MRSDPRSMSKWTCDACDTNVMSEAYGIPPDWTQIDVTSDNSTTDAQNHFCPTCGPDIRYALINFQVMRAQARDK